MKFNKSSVGNQPTTINLAGGASYSESPELELLSILLTSFVEDQFYRSANDTLGKVKELVAVCDPEFVAKAAVYARTKYGMRSISHVVASELAKRLGGLPWAKDFYKAVIHRPDDMMEIVSYHLVNNGKLSGQMKKGFALAFDKYDAYALAKYRASDKDVKLVDIVNICHPTPTERNKEALNLLIKNELKSFDTWEVEVSNAGQVATTQEEKVELKKDAWVKIVSTRKIGYFALLKNLRNLIEQAPEVIPQALEMLVDPNLIKKSLVLPFRFVTAFDEIQKLSDGKIVRKVLMALNKAVDLSLVNVPKFDGETLVVLDVSGSMEMSGAKGADKIGALFSAVLTKTNNCDFMKFADDAKYVNVNPMDSTMTIANSIRFASGSTNFHSIFQRANKKYDRIIILSDMQGWVDNGYGSTNPKAAYKDYRNQFKASPFVYSVDLAGYGSLQFPEQNVFAIAGFSGNILSTMQMLETDKKALMNEINSINFSQ